eukprot:TRINITY_DN69828_c0_g1_i1.p1 TRINITY_DN69828_c0_g1~~TRINITY_DN69828_c0_g1_i1.p1  ORF type:complete len:253 (+),score=31.74 TRINITY_DN69828_c0_g1_i1:73-831(+)
MSARALFVRAPQLRMLSGNIHGGNHKPMPGRGMNYREHSLHRKDVHDYVPVQPGFNPGSWRNMVKAPNWFKSTRDNFSTQRFMDGIEFTRGRARYEINYPQKAWSQIPGYYMQLTEHELEEYYSTPKEGVDFMYSPPAGHESNPLVIRSTTPALFMRTLAYCKGMCAPDVIESFRYWFMNPGQSYLCNRCGAFMECDGWEDVIVRPHEAPLPHEEMPPFEHLKPEFEYWMTRGFPMLEWQNFERRLPSTHCI